MELKTKVHAENGKQDLTITRTFDLPVDLLFKAHTDPAIVTQWMGSEVVKMECRKHGSYQLEKKDGKGNVVFQASGVIHEFIHNKKITRTFEMENAPLGVQLEIYDFEQITDDTSKLTIHIIYESIALRDQLLQQPFAQGINWAHNQLQEVVSKLK